MQGVAVVGKQLLQMSFRIGVACGRRVGWAQARLDVGVLSVELAKVLRVVLMSLPLAGEEVRELHAVELQHVLARVGLHEDVHLAVLGGMEDKAVSADVVGVLRKGDAHRRIALGDDGVPLHLALGRWRLRGGEGGDEEESGENELGDGSSF